MDELPVSKQPPPSEPDADALRQGSRTLVIWAVVLAAIPVLAHAVLTLDLVPYAWPSFVTSALACSPVLLSIAALLALLAYLRGDPRRRPVLAFWALMLAAAPLLLYTPSIAASLFSGSLSAAFAIWSRYAALIAPPAAATLAIVSLVQRRPGWGWAVAALVIAAGVGALALMFVVWFGSWI